MNMRYLNGRLLLGLGLGTLLAACATSTAPRPDEQLSDAEAAISEAGAANARDADPMGLNDARDKLEDARELIGEGEYGAARRLLDEATVDAELAAARAETTQAQESVDEVEETMESLRRQLQE